MSIDATESGSPGWWLIRLGKQLAAEYDRFRLLEDYAKGEPPVPFGNRKMREAYRRLQQQARTNFCGLVSETVLERMKVVGFRAGGAQSEQDDRTAWSWWQDNKMDSRSGMVHRAAVQMSRSYVIVGEDPKKKGRPLVTGEDPRQVIHESYPSDWRKVRAALKTWYDDVLGVHLAVVYLDPNEVHFFRTDRKIGSAAERWRPSQWDVDTSEHDDGMATHQLGEPPVIPFVNRPDLFGHGMGEFEDVTDIQDRINTVILDRLVVSAMQAYRQRWAKGIEVEDSHGVPNPGFDPGADLLWMVPDEHAAFGEFTATDVRPLVAAAESDVQHMAAITRTPPHYLIGQVVNVSGDALKAAETGLVSKVGERETEYGESWEQVYRLAAKVQGTEIAEDAEIIWKDPESRSLAELADASVKLQSAGVPWRTRMRMLQQTPTQINRMESERSQDALLAQVLAPTFQQPGRPPEQSSVVPEAEGV